MGLIEDLPVSRKTSWPWNEETSPDVYDLSKDWPKISIVTPSYNQGQYIEETIRSVLLQNYPNLEYIIIDGGSTDNTIEIIKKYEKWIAFWVSEPDNGQTHAINKGFYKSDGKVIAWLNSDDFYLNGAIKKLLEVTDVSKPQILFGNSILFDDIKKMQWESDIISDHQKYDISVIDYIIQPSSFFTVYAWELTKPLNEHLDFAFDWDLFIRFKNKGVDFIPINQVLSKYRKHPNHKSSNISFSEKRLIEIESILYKYNRSDIIDLYKSLKGKTIKLRQISYYMNRIKLNFLFPLIASMMYPGIFFKNKREEIEAIIRMF